MKRCNDSGGGVKNERKVSEQEQENAANCKSPEVKDKHLA